MKINPERLDLLKEPFGILIVNSLVNKKSVTDIIYNASKVVAVGDTTTEKFIGFGIIPDISVIDGVEKRITRTTKLEYKVDKVLKFKNNPGELDEIIISEIKKLVCQNEYHQDTTLSGKGAVDKSVGKEDKVDNDHSLPLDSSEYLLRKKKTPDVSLISQTENKEAKQVIDDPIELLVKSAEKIRIAIDGEEDIVALPFLMYAPVGWVVCYGQPNEGLVIVKITEESKKRAESIFNKVFI